MLRRGIALGVGVLFLIVIVLAIHGCLASRHKAALRDYSTKVTSIVSENNTKAMAPLFPALSSSSSANEKLQSLQAIDQEAASDAKQAHALSAPSEMAQAQTNLELVLDLRASAVNEITNQITTALSTTSGAAAQAAVNRITGQMQALLASDVVYSQRVKPQITKALADADAGGQIPIPSQSLTNFGWLDNAQVTTAIGADVPVKAPGGKPAPGTHGHGLTDTKINGVTLSTSGNNNVSRKAPIFTVDFQNQGENNEVDVHVNITISGGFKTIHMHKIVPQTKAGSPAQAIIPMTAPVPTSPAEVTVAIGKVPGEKTTSNNHASYTVTFGSG